MLPQYGKREKNCTCQPTTRLCEWCFQRKEEMPLTTKNMYKIEMQRGTKIQPLYNASDGSEIHSNAYAESLKNDKTT